MNISLLGERGSYRSNVIQMYVYRAGGIIVNLLYVPLLIKTLDVENYGVWLTLTTMISWLAFFDVGLGHGMRNKVAESLAKNDIQKTKEYVSTTYVLMSLIAFSIIIFSFTVIPFLNWNYLLNAKSIDSGMLTALAIWVFVLFIVQLVLKLITSLLFALQKPAQTSLVTFLSQFVGLAVVWVMSYFPDRFTLLDYGVVISVCPLIVFIVYSLIFFSWHKDIAPSFSCFKKSMCKDVANLGIQFFLIQLTAIFLFQSNSFILAQVIDSSSVVDYNVAYKYLSLPLTAFTIMVTPIWSATTDAYVKGDIEWINKTMNRLTRFFYLFSLGVVLLIVLTPISYHIWVHDTLKVNWLLMMLMGLYQILSMRTSYLCAIINGIGKVRLQFVFTLVESIVHLPLAFLLAKQFGITGVVISLSLMTFINTIWEPIQIKRLVNNTAYGIWNK